MSGLNLSGFVLHNCEICGQERLTEKELKKHMREVHVDGSPCCPFCSLSSLDPSELTLHVNAVHLDLESSEESDLLTLGGVSEEAEDEFNELWTLEKKAERGFLSPMEMKTPVNEVRQSNSEEGAESPMSVTTESEISSFKASTTSIPGAPSTSFSSPSSASTSSSPARRLRTAAPGSEEEKASSGGGGVMSPKKKFFMNGNSPGAIQKKLRTDSSPSPSSSPILTGARSKAHLTLAVKSRNLNEQTTCSRRSSRRSREDSSEEINSTVSQCPMCDHREADPEKLQEHLNRSHFDLTSPPTESLNAASSFPCPLCSASYAEATLLQSHVQSEHSEILRTPVGEASSRSKGGSSSVTVSECPVCARGGFVNCNELQRHIESHFEGESENGLKTSHDALLAQDLDRRERPRQRFDGQSEAGSSRSVSQPGSSKRKPPRDAFRDQSTSEMERAVAKGKMTFVEYHERQAELVASSSLGADTTRSVTSLLLPTISRLSVASSDVSRCLIASETVQHFASDFGDKGWGCGYRNLQMMLSCLREETEFRRRIEAGGALAAGGKVPAISKIQDLIESAWSSGFDTTGSSQLGGRLRGTKKWIGATEIVALLSSLGVSSRLMDFHRPTGSDGGHPRLFQWVQEYFEGQGCLSGGHKPPLYLQHQGHSRTIVGIELLKKYPNRLLIFDPSNGSLSRSSESGLLKALRRGPGSVKCRQYQVVAVVGLLNGEEEKRRAKVIASTRIP